MYIYLYVQSTNAVKNNMNFFFDQKEQYEYTYKTNKNNVFICVPESACSYEVYNRAEN